jgi:AcrR family transcriptional regulator
MLAVVRSAPVRVDRSHRSRRATRHPERTRGRILSAALKEFAEKGFAGARVGRIARRARVNKRMLYHYFGNKHDLFREILGKKLGERMAWATAAPEDPAESLAYWFDIAHRDPDWVRLIQWEALEAGDRALTRQAERAQAFRWGTAKLRQRQAAGLIAAELDPAHTLLSMIALTMFPVAFPQITRFATGLEPADGRFRKEWTAYLRVLADVWRPRS